MLLLSGVATAIAGNDVSIHWPLLSEQQYDIHLTVISAANSAALNNSGLTVVCCDEDGKSLTLSILKFCSDNFL